MVSSSIKLLSAVIAITMLFQANHADDTTIVSIYNRLYPKSMLEVHCWSKDIGNLYSGGIQPWSWWNFTLIPQERILYSCTFGWEGGLQFHDFTIYDQKRDGGICPRDSTAIKCTWGVKAGGPCLELSQTDKCYPWES